MNTVAGQHSAQNFSELEKHLLNDFQHEFPLSERPFADIAKAFGTDEVTVINTLQRLKDQGVISRIGPVFKPNTVGVSTLAAMAIPEPELVHVAELVSAYAEVNHNYERLHRFNLWFVVTAHDENHLQQVLNDIEQQSGYEVMSLQMEDDYFIDLGFKLAWT
jgi:DNA-binding Lrp family transcriptional regulator